jgi:Ca-activated chloride channel homolog
MNLAQPAWLILLVLLPLLGVGAVLVARLRKRQWAAFVAPRLRSSLLKRGNPLPRWFALAFLLAACAALIVSLARPYADGGKRAQQTMGRNVVIALDLSRSMRVADVKPDRLAQAKVVIYELLEAMPNERIGLIGFAGDAHELAPLTIDHSAVRETVEQADETWAPYGGSNLGEAIRLATGTLKKTGQKRNALVVLSDGDDNDGDLADMIHEARQSGVFIIAIGVGTENGDHVPNADFSGGRMVDRSGKPVISRLQPNVMRKLAGETRGHFAIAGSGADIPAMVKSAIQDLESFKLESRERRETIEFYQWLLLPAILLLFGSIVAGTRWKGVHPATAVLTGLLVFPTGSRASATDDARNALLQNRHSEAYNIYQKLSDETADPERRARYQLGAGTAAYRGGDFTAARRAYSAALLSRDPAAVAEAHFGMGTTLFQVGWKSLSSDRHPANSGAPAMEDFDTMVRERLAKIAEAEDTGSGSTVKPIERLITDWIDAIRHFDSSLAASPGNAGAGSNRDLTMAYLKRLRELLAEEKQKAAESMPQPQPGDGDSQPGDGDPEQDSDPKKKDGSGPGGDQKQQESPEGGKDPKPQKDPSKQGESGEKKEPDDKGDGKKSGNDPNETPEQQAKRILKDNADLEKGPLTPGRRMFRNPEKDW